jgi:hypothetical protein
MGTWEFVGTPEISQFDFRGQNTSHWYLLCIIGKLSKGRCRKWARMSHLDIFSTSYDKKKGRKSNWQFDSRLVKVGNWPEPCVCRWNETNHWKALKKGYNFVLDFIAIKSLHKKLCTLKVVGVLVVRISGLPTWESQDKKPFGCGPRGELQSILYGGRWWLPPSLGRGESCESRVARGLS